MAGLMSLYKIAMYSEQNTVDTTAMVERYAPMVKRIAHHMLARLPASVQLDDLIQSGMVGLLEAAKKYDTDKGASFETYASIRVRGAMLDDIRKNDWAPRSVHRNTRQITAAIKKIEGKKGRDATNIEVAKELNITLECYHSYLKDSAATRLFSYDDVIENQGESVFDNLNKNSLEPFEELQKQNFATNLAYSISELPEREKLVLSLYYTEELNLKEIGAVLGVSESRVSQIHSQAALRLKARLSNWQRETS